MVRSKRNRISDEDPADDPEIERTYALLKKDISPIDYSSDSNKGFQHSKSKKEHFQSQVVIQQQEVEGLMPVHQDMTGSSPPGSTNTHIYTFSKTEAVSRFTVKQDVFMTPQTNTLSLIRVSCRFYSTCYR